MTSAMRLLCLPVFFASAIAVAAPPGSGPTTKTASPCGEKVLPLAVGNQWTYARVPASIPVDSPSSAGVRNTPDQGVRRSIDNQIARIAPIIADTIVITVTAIDNAANRDTVITLEEKSTTDLTKDPKKPVRDERSISTTITCNARKFELSPDSFWFAGEPGGYLGLKLDSVQRSKGTSFQFGRGSFDAQWREDVVIRWTRTSYPGSDAKPGSGKLELERQFTAQQPEPVQTDVGPYNAEKLGLVTTGRVTLDGAPPDGKPMELPANWLSTLWIAQGAGVVQTVNAFAHMYRLSAVTLK